MAIPKRKNIDGVAPHVFDEADNSYSPASSSTPMPVTVVSGASNTQYTEGDIDASITGTAMMMEGAGNALVPAQGTAADGLLVNLGSNNDVTIASLPLPSGAATEAKQDTIITHIDGIETLIGTTNTTLTTIDGRVDGLETLVGTTNSTLTTIDGRVDGIEGLLTTIDADTGALAGTVSGGNINIFNNGNFVSTNNATTTPLTGGATYTGSYDEIIDYISMTISLVVDRSGTLYIEFSQDGVTLDHSEVYTITVTTGGVAEGFSFQAMKEAKYFRIKYTNGGTAQGTFKLQVIVNQYPVVGEVHQVAQPLIAQTDAQVVKGVIYGQTTAGGGSYVAVKVTPSGAIAGAVTINDGTDTMLITAAGEANVLESNSAAIAASLSVLDDWDETDRAKVNLIVGQAGVQGDTGVVTANTQRVVLATDVSLPGPGSGATKLGKAEDAAHSTGDVGVMSLGVRNDNLTQFSGTNGDYTPIATEDTGRVYTRSALEYAQSSQTFTGTGSSASTDFTKKPVKYHSLQVTATGAVTSWTVNLQGSNNNSNWTTMVTHDSATSTTGVLVPLTTPFPCLFTRINCSAIVLGGGTNIICAAVSTQ